MSMCSQIFCEPDFEQKLNTNPFLFCCSNGILELRHKNAQEPREHVIFRQGRPEDYMSFLAGRNYPETDAIAYIPYKEFVAAKDPRIAEMDAVINMQNDQLNKFKSKYLNALKD
jgi:hypothetical protein